jgi:arylsulfatase A
MRDGGAHVPLIASWPGATPAGEVRPDLVDFTDMLSTFADLAGAKLPAGVTFDGRSFAPQLRGEAGKPRDWVFVQLANLWYVRERNWKLTETGELFDMTAAPFEEKPVPAGEQPEVRKRLKAVLDQLSPAGGKTTANFKAGNPTGKKKQPSAGGK